jgi:uncharacterized membrane protein YcaP (DUF421 family)
MKPEEIKLWDWQRLFLGEVPAVFMLEIVLRMASVYIILMISMRILGKRMSSQLSRNDLAALVSLAAAIGVPILAPDKGILSAVVIAIVVVSISKMTARWSAKNQKVEAFTQGTLDVLVQDCVMQVKTMTRTRISKERVMAELRSEKITHLGEVKRLFIEANGTFTLIKENPPRPGLAVIPESDTGFLNQLPRSTMRVCRNCGNPNPADDQEMICDNCQKAAWVSAIQPQTHGGDIKNVKANRKKSHEIINATA